MLNCLPRSCVPATLGPCGFGSRAQARSVKLCGQSRAHRHSRQSSCLSLRFCAMTRLSASAATTPQAKATRTDTQLHSTDIEVQIADLQHMCQNALKTLGYNDEQSVIISEVCCDSCLALPMLTYTALAKPFALQVLLYAQLRNNSNNMVKVITGGLDKLSDQSMPEIQQQSDISAVIDGQQSAGIIVMKQALHLAMAKAKSSGCGIIGTNHTATGSGAIGSEFPPQPLIWHAQNCIYLAFTSSPVHSTRMHAVDLHLRNTLSVCIMYAAYLLPCCGCNPMCCIQHEL